MILIVDSGSTKADWIFCTHDGTIISHQKTEGINPFHQDSETIRNILSTLNLSVVPSEETVSSIHFYGSGLRAEFRSMMASLLAGHFHVPLQQIEAESDLLGAARSLCGDHEGIACILGTGANSCLYDGKEIIENTPSLGYILGDEGSGAVIGRNLLNAIYKGTLPVSLKEKFEQTFGLSMADVIHKVYREPLANRWMASLTVFISEQKPHYPELSLMVIDAFRFFLRNNLLPYHRQDLPISAVGSIAHYFYDELCLAAEAEGFRIGKVLQSPIDGLVAYHTQSE